MQWLLFSYCCDFSGRIIYDMALDGYLDAVAFGIKDDTFVIPVPGGPGLAHDGNTVIGHLLGKAIHLFF